MTVGVLAVARARFPTWHVHPTVWLVVAAMEGLYLLGLRRFRPEGARVSRAQAVTFSAGVLATWIAADWPIHDIAEHSLYSVHMVQHILLSLVAPPLLLLGTPDWLARGALERFRLMPIMRRLTKPFVALVLFNVTIVVTHWPAMVTVSLHDEWAHFGLHALLMTTATLMWFPVLSPLPELPRLNAAAQMFYLFLQSLVPTVPASFLTLSDGPLYKAYAHLPKLWGITTIDDQRVAGLLMKVGGGFILWGFIASIFFRWAYQEERGEGALLWEDVERELKQVGPPPAA